MSGIPFGTNNQEDKETTSTMDSSLKLSSGALATTTPASNPSFGAASPSAAPAFGRFSFGEKIKMSTTSEAAGFSSEFGASAAPSSTGGFGTTQGGAFGAQPAAAVGGFGGANTDAADKEQDAVAGMASTTALEDAAATLEFQELQRAIDEADIETAKKILKETPEVAKERTPVVKMKQTGGFGFGMGGMGVIGGMAADRGGGAEVADGAGARGGG